MRERPFKAIMQVTINLKAELLDKIEQVRGPQSRSGFIVAAVYEHFSGGDADKIQLLRDIEALRETQRRNENEIEYLRLETSKLHDALAQRLLTDGKPSFWSRFRRK